MKLNVLIVDDESPARNLLKKLLLMLFPDLIAEIYECDSVRNAIKCINQFNPDIVFLDIQMPDENGFELFKYFQEINFEIIFTTAHKDFAINAIKSSAFDYLLKPINVVELKASISRFEIKKEKTNQMVRLTLLLENLDVQTPTEKKIVISTKKGFEVLSKNAILYCEAEDSYSNFVTVEKKVLSSKSFKDSCEILNDSNFIRIHKSYVINTNFIKSFNTSEYTLELSNGVKLPVSDKSFTKKKLIDAISK